MNFKEPRAIKGLIIDMDGVVWRGSQPIGDLPEVFARIESLGLKYILATNNATKTPEQYVEKLKEFGAEIGIEHVVNSSQAAARYLKKLYPQGGPVFIVGEVGLAAALKDAGFYPADKDVLAVIAGLDRRFDFEKLRQATAYIRSGAIFLATNPDPTFPTPEGLSPGAGAIVAAIETASETQPVIAGKPEPGLYETAMETMGTLPEETLVIGDRLITDILGGQRLGCLTALVLSGVTTPDQAESWQPQPDIIAATLADVLESISEPLR